MDDFLTWKDLYTARFSFTAPFRLKLTDNHIFYGEKTIRLAPKKRLTLFGKWQDQSVVAKIFFHPKYARKQAEKDANGSKLLSQHHVNSPKLLYEGVSPCQKFYVLIYERIHHAKTLDAVWRDAKSIENKMVLLQSVTSEIVKMQKQHVLQNDFYPKNFLLAGNCVYMIDGTEIRQYPQLTKWMMISNFALFLSFLGLEVEKYVKDLFEYFVKLHDWQSEQTDLITLLSLIKNHREKYWSRLKKKIYEESSDYSLIKSWSAKGVVDRNYATLDFFKLLKSIYKKTFHHKNVIQLDQQTFVIHRYHLTNFYHWIKAWLFSSDAYQAWQKEHQRYFHHCTIEKPIALIEKKWLGFPIASYLIFEISSDVG